MRDLYICSGKYHLFCALMLKLTDNSEREGDLLLCDVFEGASELFKKFNSESNMKLFNQIFMLDRNQYDGINPNNINRWQKICKIFLNKITKEENRLGKALDNKYSRIYIAGAVPSLVEYCLWAHKQRGSDIMLFDDGLGSRFQWEDHGLKRRFFDYSRGEDFWNSLKCKHFFSTNRVCETFPHIPIVSQCKPNKKEIENNGLDYEVIKNTLNRIFGYEIYDDPINKYDIIYFAAGFDLYDWLARYSQQEVSIINYIGEKNDNFIVKRHPNSSEEYDSDIKTVSEFCMPEISYLNNELEHKLLISSGSAAVFNPSFVFDKNPFLILTYKLFGGNEDLARGLFRCSEQELKNKLEKTLFSGYRDQSKIYIPRNKQELLQAIDDYKLRVGHKEK